LKFNVYDIRIPCEVPGLCYDFSNLDKFLARDDVKKSLGVENRTWAKCDSDVYAKLE